MREDYWEQKTTRRDMIVLRAKLIQLGFWHDVEKMGFAGWKQKPDSSRKWYDVTGRSPDLIEDFWVDTSGGVPYVKFRSPILPKIAGWGGITWKPTTWGKLMVPWLREEGGGITWQHPEARWSLYEPKRDCRVVAHFLAARADPDIIMIHFDTSSILKHLADHLKLTDPVATITAFLDVPALRVNLRWISRKLDKQLEALGVTARTNTR